ncbi:hypothetical protein C8Q79DRAFT_871010, partial [Trametes meyenii]
DHHLELFACLRAEDMSGDETEHDADGKRIRPLAYLIKDSAWMSDAYRTFMRTLDDWRYSKWADLNVGNAPRIRKPQGKTVNVKAPTGLWRNCYSSTWLAVLKPHQRRALRIIEEDYNFTL